MRNAIVKKGRRYLFLLVLSCGACGVPTVPPPPPPSNSAQTPYVFDIARARSISDSIVDALIKNDRPALKSRMEKAAREYYNQAEFDSIIDTMFGAYGKPLEAQFKKAEQGRKWAVDGYDKPMLKHWYAVKTSRHDYGAHFIFVEIVPDEEGYASSGVSIVNFPMGVPEDMR